MGPSDVRKNIVDRLEQDLIGPFQHDEVLRAEKIKPSDVYLTGILWPIGERMGAEDDDGSTGDDENDEGTSTASTVGQQRPCTMGISFSTNTEEGEHQVTIKVKFATYQHYIEKDDEGKNQTCWKRVQHVFDVENIYLPDSTKQFPKILSNENIQPLVELHIRTLPSKFGLLTTVTLINRSQPEEPDSILIESLSLFQTEITVIPVGNTKIVSRPPAPVANDDDEKANRLLYRNVQEFAAGHQCSATWEPDGNNAKSVSTAWLPKTLVPAFKENGDNIFSTLVTNGSLAAELLSKANDQDLCNRLDDLINAYTNWINNQKAEISQLKGEIKVTAELHIATCNDICVRMRSGVEAIRRDTALRASFRLTNAAMALQHSWKLDSSGKPLRPLVWRPFQLGFILLAIESTCHSKSKDRDIFDLLWFPTGGGKTEAYLAIIGMLAWYRRLSNDIPDDGDGNAAVMRYTLRLLTAQQFERAASMTLACELIRKGMAFPRLNQEPVGKSSFSIGLWVGKDATPNMYADALEARGQKDISSAEQINTCPCCQGKVRWQYDDVATSVQPSCESLTCSLGEKFGLWPVFTVDSDIYREKPTLLIGTVDKFAQLPFKNEVAGLFGFGTNKSTDLIIQDELHLISGPLGTVTGLYETAFDWLLCRKNSRAKVIGSTATIRKADQQIRALFDRKSCQFPPPGLSYDNSGFAVVDYENQSKWRLYVGISTAGRSAKFSLQATAGSLLQSGGDLPGQPTNLRDGYATLLCYFNSLRELGGAIVQMLDDVPDSIGLYSKQRNEDSRKISIPKELTSRVSQKEIIEILSELKRSAADPDCVDVVLATNMVSVGVDVPRLGLMIVNGQPKTRSEYIQSTSRVGRSNFPGLVINVLNASKARDRSHFETFPAWHKAIYRDVEATSVTPFASRARDRALRAVMVSMIRHGDLAMSMSPDLKNAKNTLLADVVNEIERRITAVDNRELIESTNEIDENLNDWESRAPTYYIHKHRPNQSLLQYAETYARKVAAGKLPSAAWPIMNTMRSVEPSSRFRITEVLSPTGGRNRQSINKNSDNANDEETNQVPRWRRNDAG